MNGFLRFADLDLFSWGMSADKLRKTEIKSYLKKFKKLNKNLLLEHQKKNQKQREKQNKNLKILKNHSKNNKMFETSLVYFYLFWSLFFVMHTGTLTQWPKIIKWKILKRRWKLIKDHSRHIRMATIAPAGCSMWHKNMFDAELIGLTCRSA